MTLSPGSLYEGYKVIKELKSGGFGRTYLVEGGVQNTQFVMKVKKRTSDSHPNSLHSGEASRQLLREIETYRQISHSNIIRCVKFFRDKDPVLILEYAEEGDLEDYVERNGKRISEWTSLEMARDTCAALHCLHQAGLVHRDVKPKNIFISKGGVLKLGDLGLASPVSDSGDKGLSGHTPLYASPEQLAGQGASERTDVYSLGLVLYFLLTGCDARDTEAFPTLKNGTAAGRKFPPLVEKMRAKAEEGDFILLEIPDPREYRAVSRSTIELLKWLLNEDQRQRPSSTTLLAHLEALCSSFNPASVFDTAEAEDSGKLAVLWLAEQQKNNFIAMSSPPVELRSHLGRLKAPEDLNYARIGLRYEPRSLAVSPSGDRVAVGLKSGEIYVVFWDFQSAGIARSDQRLKRLDYSISGGSAVRALTFLLDGTIVASHGSGSFVIIRADPGAKPEIVPLKDSPRSPGEFWARKLSEIIPVSSLETPSSGNVLIAVGISAGGEKLHLLEKLGASEYAARIEDQEVVIDGMPKTARKIVSAAWSRRRLWLLTRRGEVFSCELSNGKLRGTRREANLWPDRPTRRASFRKIEGCLSGLAVLADSYVTFIYHTVDDESLLRPGAKLIWQHVPRAIDLTAGQPYRQANEGRDAAAPNGDARAFSEPESDWRNPIWIVVATEDTGVVWIRWSRLSSWPRSTFFRSIGGDSVLYVQFGWKEHGAPLLAVAGREHYLEIASVIDRDSAEEILDSAEMNLFRDNVDASRTGFGWRLAFEHLEAEGLRFPYRAISADMESFSEEQLRSLPGRLLAQYDPGSPDRSRQLRELKRWWLEAMKRSKQLGGKLDAEITRDLARRTLGVRYARDYELKSFVALLRKWVLYGESYGRKQYCLLDLAKTNLAAERSLDALFYLSRVFRQRVDWTGSEKISQANEGVVAWQIESSKDNSFALVSLTDGGVGVLVGGRPVVWDFSPTKVDLRKEFGLNLSQTSFRLYRTKTRPSSLLKKTNPRRLLIRETRSPGVYLCLFTFKSYPHPDERSTGPEDQPLLTALVCKVLDSRVEVLSVATRNVSSEVFGIGLIPDSTDQWVAWPVPLEFAFNGRYLVLLGTSGQWVSSEITWSPLPFVEVPLAMQSPFEIAFGSEQIPEFEVAIGNQVPVSKTRDIPTIDYNPCWAIETWILNGRLACFVAMNEGSIHVLERAQGRLSNDWVWRQEDLHIEEITGAEELLRNTSFGSPVWHLRLVAGEVDTMLGFGTGTGLTGVFRLMPGPDASIEVVVLDDLKAPICHVGSFRDEGESKIAVAAQDGSVCIYSTRTAYGDGPDIQVAGNREDHFRLNRRLLSFTVVGRTDFSIGKLAEPCPSFVAGDTEGRISQGCLAVPRGTSRRRRLSRYFWKLIPPGEGGILSADLETLGEKRLEWLKVFSVQDSSLLRFAFWHEIKIKGRNLNKLLEGEPNLAEFHSESVKYCEFIEAASADAIRRFFPSRATAKVFWSEGGTTCREALALLLSRPMPTTLQNEVLGFYHRAFSTLKELGAKWFGLGGDEEGKALIHCGQSLISWELLILIASYPSGPGNPLQVQKKLIGEIRWAVLNDVLRPRLNHADDLVRRETLRVLNSELGKAVVELHGNSKGSRTSGWPGSQSSLRLVGTSEDSLSLGERSGLDSLASAISRLYGRLPSSGGKTSLGAFIHCKSLALLALLAPDDAMLVAKVASSNRLLDQTPGFGKMLTLELENMIREHALGSQMHINAALALLRSFMLPRTQTRQGDITDLPFRELLVWYGKQDSPSPSFNVEFCGEFSALVLVSEWLKRVPRSDFDEFLARSESLIPNPYKRKSFWRVIELFKDGSGSVRFFSDSVRHLKQLDEWREARVSLEGERRKREEAEISLHLDILEEEIQRSGLPFPELGLIRSVVDSWRAVFREARAD